MIKNMIYLKTFKKQVNIEAYLVCMFIIYTY
mgnify:CR=1 FL=1